jgi:signal transduction histidine kinase
MKDHFIQFFESTGAARMLPQLLIRTDTGAIIDVNPASEAFYGWPRATMRGMLMGDLDTDTGELLGALADAPNAKSSATPSAATNGWSERRAHRVAGGTQRPVAMWATMVDVGEHHLLHVVVHEAAERETPGGTGNSGTRDARRIVHDFNNLLTVLRGSAVFLRDGIDASSQAGEDLAAIERATDRAEELMNELLSALPKS